MKKILIIVFVFGIVFNLQSQGEIAKQEILELTDSELENIGVLMKGKKIIINNNIPGFEKYDLSVEGNSYSPLIEEGKYPLTEFDFYPYYITNMDSLWGYMWRSDKENELKGDPLYQRKMMLNYLVPIRMKQLNDKEKWGDDLLYWFTPTKSFCKAVPERYKIIREYTTDSLITSDVALMLNDDELKHIGFIINDSQICLNTFKRGKDKSKPKSVISWYNNKTDCGSSFSSGGGKNRLGDGKDGLKESFMYPDTDDGFNTFNANYHIVQVTFVESGTNNFTSASFKGRAIPIYIRNSTRNYHAKYDVVIYLKYSADLVERLPKHCKWWEMPDVYTVHLK